MKLPQAQILNKIAETTLMKHSAAILLFRKDQKGQNCIIREQAQKLLVGGVHPLLIAPYTTLAPLLAERDALTVFLSRAENSSLIGTIPNPRTPEQAVQLAQLEQPHLELTQLVALEKMLTALM